MKERLTGAIILVVVVVLLVPELLSGPSRSAPPAQPTLPTTASSEEAPLRSYTINLQDDAHASGAGTASAPTQASGPAQPTPITEGPTPNPAQPEADSATGQADSGQTGSGPTATGQATGGQTGASQTAAGQNPAGQAEDPTQTSAATSPSDRSPPSPQTTTPQPRPQATPQRSVTPERHAAEHSTTTEHSATAERAEASGTAGAWMVQLGVFSVQANAERLAQELKTQGFHTLVSQIGSAGRPMWRVRAGPVVEHAAAEQLSARLRAAGHAGSVVPK